MLENIIIIIVIVLIPIIPAWILYKFLPGEGRSFAKGPFRGLNIQLSGAFAGYFVVLLFAGSLYMTLPKTKCDLWKVKGKIKLEQGNFDLNDISISIIPPDQDIVGDGDFRIDNVPVINDVEGVKLLIHKSGYRIKSFFLDETKQEELGLSDYVIEHNKKDKEIKIIGDIILKKQREGSKEEEENI